MGLMTVISVFVLSMMTLKSVTQETTCIQISYQPLNGCDVDQVSPDSAITNLTVSSRAECANSCLRTKTCHSFNICGYQNSWFKCYLLPSLRSNKCAGLAIKSGCSYMEMSENICKNGGTWNSPVCECADGYAGQYCERYIRSCQEGWDLGVRVGQFYMVQPLGSPVAYRLYCNLKYAETAYFFVRWRGASCSGLNFNRTWNEYKEGWGDVECGEYFVGLETMYQLMKYERFQVHVYGKVLGASNTQVDYFYSSFTVLSEAENYKMNYDSAFGWNGDDGLGAERPRDFCTRDRDCGSCAVDSGGGWWFANGCGGHPLTSSLADFKWPVNGIDQELDNIYLQLDHMSYL